MLIMFHIPPALIPALIVVGFFAYLLGAMICYGQAESWVPDKMDEFWRTRMARVIVSVWPLWLPLLVIRWKRRSGP